MTVQNRVAGQTSAPGDGLGDSDQSSAPILGVEDLARVAAGVLESSSYPALVLQVPSERIVAAIQAATQLLDPAGGVVVGRLLAEFTADRPDHGRNIFAGGRLNGFQTSRTLRRAQGPDVTVQMWVRSFDHQPSTRLVLVVFSTDRSHRSRSPAASTRVPPGAPAVAEAPAVVGTADAGLLIERISSDAEFLFGRPVAGLLGRTVLELIAEDDAPDALAALMEATDTQEGVALVVTIRAIDAAPRTPPVVCELLLLPLEPSPGCAFVFLPTTTESSGAHINADLSAVLLRLSRGAQVAQLARSEMSKLTERDMPGLSTLTTRELEIVSRLLDGDRAPAIAAELFLSQSTVRNHLGSVFAKLGVSSQQQLLTLLRRAVKVG